MDSATKEHLLDRFRHYLEQLPETGAAEEGEPRQTDLYALFTELVTLKNEVRLESRQVKNALDQFRAVFDTLHDSQTQLNSELDRARGALSEQRRTLLRPLLLELVELYDRLAAGLHALQSHRPSLFGRLCRRQRALLHAVSQGQDISLRRLEQLLNAQQVVALPVEGRPLDPHTMRAAEVDNRTDVANGIVTEELRKGYTWQGELLRLAEVKVNKRAESPAIASSSPLADPANDLDE